MASPSGKNGLTQAYRKDTFHHSSELARGLRTELDQAGKERIKDMVRNPLRLALLCYYWQLRQGALPRTKAALYQRFVEAWYEWKQESFPTTSDERRALNAALGELAVTALAQKDWRFRLPYHVVRRVLGESDTPLFQSAHQLGWLLQLGVAADNPHEAIYAFPHPTFQEYFAAKIINDWKDFLNHNPENPSQGTYHVFARPWKEVILLWLGREDIAAAEKEQFISALNNFRDDCHDFYRYRVHLLAAAGVAEFTDCSLGDAIVTELAHWTFGDFDEKKQCWYEYFEPLKKAAGATLRETDPERATAAIHGLFDVLSESTASWDARIFRDAMEALATIGAGNPETVHELMERVCSSRDRDNADLQVIESLKRNLYAVHKLIERLSSDQEKESLGTVIRILGQIGIGNRDAAQALVQVLSTPYDDNSEVHPIAIETLGDLGANDPGVVNTLVEILATPEKTFLHRAVVDSLGKIGHGHQTAIQVLVKIVETTPPNEEMYYAAGKSLAKIGVGSKQVIRLYMQCLHAIREERAVWQLIEWLGDVGVGTRDPDAVEILTDLSQPTQEETIRWRAARNLERIDPGNSGAAETLLGLLRTCQSETSCNKETPFNAARILAEIGSHNEGATRILVELLRSSRTARTQSAAISCLWQIRSGQEAISALIDVLKTAQDKSLLANAADTLAKVGTGDSTAADALAEFLGSKRHKVHSQVVQHLHHIGVGHPVIISALAELLRSSGDNDPFTYKMTVQCLEKVAPGEPYAIDALIELVDRTRNEENRRATLLALGTIGVGNQRAAEAMIKVLRTANNDETLAAAARSLMTLLSAELFPLAVAGLKDLVQDQVREHDSDRYQESFSVLWHCAQNLPYPDFYQAWHGSSAATGL